MTALAGISTIIRCKHCLIEQVVEGSSAFPMPTQDGWQIDQFTFYNPNGEHYCIEHRRTPWLAYCLGEDSEGNCGGCFGEGEASGVLVSAPVDWTNEQVLDEIVTRKLKCEGGNLIFGIEKVEEACHLESLANASVVL